MRKTVATLAVSLVMVFILAAGLVPVSATAAASGTISYFQVSGGVCTSTVWSSVASDGNVPGLFPNNVGGPPKTAVVGTGSICIEVSLTGAALSSTYTITSNKLTGTLLVHTDASGSGSNETVFLSAFDGECTTVPITISPHSSPSVGSTSGQINHVFVGVGCTTTTSVPEFPVAGSLGLLLVVAIAVPLLVAARKWRSPIQIA